MNESTGAKTLGGTEIDWRERKPRGQIWKNSSCALMFFWSFEENSHLRGMFPLQCSIESVWTGGSRPLKKKHSNKMRWKYAENAARLFTNTQPFDERSDSFGVLPPSQRVVPELLHTQTCWRYPSVIKNAPSGVPLSAAFPKATTEAAVSVWERELCSPEVLLDVSWKPFGCH